MQAERALQSTFGPILTPPTVEDSTASTTPKVLTADLANDHVVRRVRVVNLDDTDTIAVLFVRRGGSLTGLTVADGARILPGGELSLVVSSRVRLGVVASANTPAYNAVVSDV